MRSTEKPLSVMEMQLLVRLNPDLLSIKVSCRSKHLLSYKYIGSVLSICDAFMAAFVLVLHQQLLCTGLRPEFKFQW